MPKRRRPRDRKGEIFADRMMYLLTAAYMSWPGQTQIWEHNDNRNTALMRRFAHQKEIFETEQCTQFEAMIYISTSTLENRPGHDLASVYFWLFRQELADQADEVLGDSGRADLEGPQLEILVTLRRWIFKTQMNRIKLAAKEERDNELEEERGRLEAQQPRLF